MLASPIWQTGCWERSKAGVHGAACALSAVMAGYNTLAWIKRRERHLAINAVIYTLATCWEVKQTGRHWDRLVVGEVGAKSASGVSTRTTTAGPDRGSTVRAA